MRLHSLSITAFGPFADEVRVDFDELSDAGLFLLTGATGAGKTSILDAVCFALYGQVPGDRAGAKHLRSDHAAPGQAPEVALRFSVGSREFSFTRSPAWMRPKLRGNGETKVQAHVLVEERVEGAWKVLTNRLDDAGLLVTDLLGMSATQFTQVAMLPQGRFQAFLRATSAERHSVLQQLFRTDRFERIEGWLVERRTQTRRATERGMHDVSEIVNRIQEASATDLEPSWANDLPHACVNGDLERWVHHLNSAAVQAETVAATQAQEAESVLTSTSEELAAAHKTVDLQRRGRQAQEDLQHAEQRVQEIDEYRRRLRDHERAAPLSELVITHRVAQTSAAQAEQRWAEHRDSESLSLPENIDRPTLVTLQRAAHDAQTRASDFAPRAEMHRSARAQQSALSARRQTLEAGVAELELELAGLPGVIADAVAAVHEARAAAARLPVAQARVSELERASALARRAEVIGLEIAAERTDVLEATDLAHKAKDRYLDLREARINGMASELAGQLAAGCSCPVCGSSSHPAPAQSSLAGIRGIDEDQARKELDDAEFELQARRHRLATLDGELATLNDQLEGLIRAQIPSDLSAARDEVDRLEPLVATLDFLVARESTCRADLDLKQAELRQAMLDRADLWAQSDQLNSSVEAIEKEWASLLAEVGTVADELTLDHAGLLAARRRQADALDGALAAFDDWRAAASAAADLAERVHNAALNAGFSSTADASAALLEHETRAELSEVVATSDSAVAQARKTLSDETLAAALSTPPPPITTFETAVANATAAARRSTALVSTSAARRERLEQLSVQLAAAVESWRPLEEQHRVAANLASFVEGKSVDNLQRMRLAAYVLAERLKQVVDAANERLVAMTDQRYALEHTDDRGFGEQRGGLSLRIRDDWNGVHRDPATLSGGETFVVSLALALGLADTVAHEAGGTDIDTLFIDEGFGSLDADTLEDVMDTLDSLRDGGRVVGLVSHVPELRSRITTQLEVSKGRTGSGVRACVSSG